MQATPNIQTSLRFPPDLHAWLHAVSDRDGLSLNQKVMAICSAARDAERTQNRAAQDAH